MKIRDVMTKNPVALKRNYTLGAAVKVLSRHKISGCPVTDGKGHVVGIVAKSDIVRLVDVYGNVNKGKMALLAAGVIKGNIDMRKIRTMKVKDFLKKGAITIEHDDSLYKAVRLMNRHDIERLPVVRGKKLVGIITRSDVVRALDRIGK